MAERDSAIPAGVMETMRRAGPALPASQLDVTRPALSSLRSIG
nr:hypothetical protein [Austwickia chelonae]